MNTESVTPSLAKQNKVGRDIVILCVACITLLAPFVGKPANVDDPLFIWAAHQISGHPLDFYGFKLNWNGHLEAMAVVMENPPLQSYFLAGAAKMLGWSEISLHLAILPISVLAVIGLYFLARAFCGSPLMATGLMLLCPAFLVSATTLMCDVPMLCLWLWAIVAWIRGSTRSNGWLPLAGFLAGTAILTKYSAICLLPLLIAYSAVYSFSRRTRIVQALSLLIPLMMVVAYNRLTAIQYGQGLFTRAIAFSQDFTSQKGVPPLTRLLDGFIFLGGSAIAAALLGYVAATRRIQIVILAVVPLAIWAVKECFIAPSGWRTGWPFYLQADLLLTAGIVVVITCCSDLQGATATQLRDGLFLLLWIGGVFIFAAKFNWVLNARSFLPLLPPVCILTARMWERRAPKLLRAHVMVLFLAGLVTVLSTVSDYALADADRKAATRATQKYGSRPVWFVGHWGFQFYMQQLGALPLDDVSPACKRHDILVIAINNYGIVPSTVQTAVIDAFSIDGLPFMTLVNARLGAGFYFSPGDRLPFIFGYIPGSWFDIAFVEGVSKREKGAIIN